MYLYDFDDYKFKCSKTYPYQLKHITALLLQKVHIT